MSSPSPIVIKRKLRRARKRVEALKWARREVAKLKACWASDSVPQAYAAITSGVYTKDAP
jgi:hypothetical protein